MKIKVTRTDGVVIEVEGTLEECMACIPFQGIALSPVYVPYYSPTYYNPPISPLSPPFYYDIVGINIPLGGTLG